MDVKYLSYFSPFVRDNRVLPEYFQTPDGLLSTDVTAGTQDSRQRREERGRKRRRLSLRIAVQPRASAIGQPCMLFFTLLLCQPALVYHSSLFSLNLTLSPRCEITGRPIFFYDAHFQCASASASHMQSYKSNCCGLSRLQPRLWLLTKKQIRRGVPQSTSLQIWDQTPQTPGCEILSDMLLIPTFFKLFIEDVLT